MDMPADLRGERLQIMLSAEELQVVDEFRFKQRMPSRASAVRELLKRGLAAEGFAAVVNKWTDGEALFGARSTKPTGTIVGRAQCRPRCDLTVHSAVISRNQIVRLRAYEAT